MSRVRVQAWQRVLGLNVPQVRQGLSAIVASVGAGVVVAVAFEGGAVAVVAACVFEDEGAVVGAGVVVGADPFVACGDDAGVGEPRVIPQG